jgi:hypothetical protein
VGLAHLADVLFVGGELVSLFLSDCQIGRDGAARIAAALATSASLTTLVLSNERMAADGSFPIGNKIDAVSAASLGGAVRKAFALTRLDLSNNDIQDAGAWALAQALLPVNKVPPLHHYRPLFSIIITSPIALSTRSPHSS